MTKLTDSKSGWDYDDLMADIIKKMSEIKKYSKESFEHETKKILERFLNGLPNGEILSDGYFKKFVQFDKMNLFKLQQS
jgi:hypothetical protein